MIDGRWLALLAVGGVAGGAAMARTMRGSQASTLDVARWRQDRPIVAVALPWPVAIAVLNDTFRFAGIRPASVGFWAELRSDPQVVRQAPIVAALLQATGFRAPTAAALAERGVVVTAQGPSIRAEVCLRRFFARIAPIPATAMIEASSRREEVLRHWAATFGVQVTGEESTESSQILENLDLRLLLRELQKTSAGKRSEAAARFRVPRLQA